MPALEKAFLAERLGGLRILSQINFLQLAPVEEFERQPLPAFGQARVYRPTIGGEAQAQLTILDPKRWLSQKTRKPSDLL